MAIEDIKLIVIDVDGTITDGNYYLNEAGVLFKNFNTKDMHAIYRAGKDGFKILILTGATDRCIYAKMGKWGHKIISGSQNKKDDLALFLEKENLTWNNVAFIGDGENDYTAMQEAAFTACPSNAIPEIMQLSHYIAQAEGGNGAVYEIIRHLFKLCKIDWKME